MRWAPYLSIKVGLLESGASHGSGSWLLVSGPDFRTVGGLGDLNGDRVASLGRSLELVSCRRHSRFELTGGDAEGAAGDAHAAREAAKDPQLRCGHCCENCV